MPSPRDVQTLPAQGVADPVSHVARHVVRRQATSPFFEVVLVIAPGDLLAPRYVFDNARTGPIAINVAVVGYDYRSDRRNQAVIVMLFGRSQSAHGGVSQDRAPQPE